MSPLELTYELPVERSLRFLDLRLYMFPHHICWSYEPRGKKPLLPFTSAHSKLVKRGIVRSCLQHSITKSCHHSMQKSFDGQVSRLKSAGYPLSLLTSVTEVLLRKIKQGGDAKRPRDRTIRPVVVPYMHTISHGLKKIAQRANVEVVFSAPQKLSSLCRKVSSSSVSSVSCSKKHKSKFVPCVEGVIYSFPLSCGKEKQYIGQTGRCLNDRLREHNNNIANANSGHLGIHCRDCGCSARLDSCVVLGKSTNQLTREIVEAANISRRNSRCVSTPSLTLSEKELDYVNTRCIRM
ncbi:unnamed protein product [Ixodes hexagonus]